MQRFILGAIILIVLGLAVFIYWLIPSTPSATPTTSEIEAVVATSGTIILKSGNGCDATPVIQFDKNTRVPNDIAKAKSESSVSFVCRHAFWSPNRSFVDEITIAAPPVKPAVRSLWLGDVILAIRLNQSSDRFAPLERHSSSKTMSLSRT